MDLSAETIKADGMNILIGGEIKTLWVDVVSPAAECQDLCRSPTPGICGRWCGEKNIPHAGLEQQGGAPGHRIFIRYNGWRSFRGAVVGAEPAAE